MPEKVHECVESVLDDNPDYSESRAWAICQAEMQADVDTLEIQSLAEAPGLQASDFEQLANESGWEDHGGVWTHEADGLLVYEESAVPDDLTQAAGFGVDIFRIVQAEDSDMELDGDVMGVGVDFPNAGVYVDWRIDAWPDDEQLDEPHVSDYGSVDDLEQATGGVVEPLQTVQAEDVADDAPDQQADLPAECRACGENERMDGAMVCEECFEGDADQQAVTIAGLSQEAVDDITRRYNADVVDGEASAAPTDHESPDE